MANYPKKMMDPTEAALSAIQEALNVRDDDEHKETQPEAGAAPPPPPHHEEAAEILPESEPATPTFDEAVEFDRL